MLLTGLRLPGRPGAHAIEVVGDRIAWTGPAEEVAAPAQDHDGLLLTSPFVDAHVHATASGLLLDGLDLTGCAHPTELLDRVAAAPGALVWGHGWEEDRWPGGAVPSRSELDRAAGGRPVYLSRIDVHSALVSSALTSDDVVAAAGWSAEGALTADAHHLVRRRALAALDPDRRRSAQRAFLEHAARHGVAEVHECAGPEISGRADLADLLALDIGVAVVGFWGEAATSAEEAVALLGDAAGLAGDLFVDGSLGSRTAALTDPYADADHRGRRYLTAEQVVTHVAACSAAGIPAGFHVIGDAAVETAVAAFEEAAARAGTAARPGHRLEHVEMIDAGQAARLATLGVVASVQPLFDALWGGPDGMYAARLGRERAAGLNPFRTLLDAGVTLALGSDSPVTPLDPWAAVDAAVGHRTPGSRITTAEALAAHTGGRPVPVSGGPADYVLWDGRACRRTVRAGRVVHDTV